jgi:hypothetical protein
MTIIKWSSFAKSFNSPFTIPRKIDIIIVKELNIHLKGGFKMEDKAHVLNMICLFIGLILGFIGVVTTFQNMNYGTDANPSISLMILSGFLILSGVIGYNIQSKK